MAVPAVAPVSGAKTENSWSAAVVKLTGFRVLQAPMKLGIGQVGRWITTLARRLDKPVRRILNSSTAAQAAVVAPTCGTGSDDQLSQRQFGLVHHPLGAIVLVGLEAASLWAILVLAPALAYPIRLWVDQEPASFGA